MLAGVKPLICWLSPPCTGGSPVLNLTKEPRRSELIEKYKEQLEQTPNDSEKIMQFADIKMLELSRACSFWKLKPIRDFVDRYNMEHRVDIPRCPFWKEMKSKPNMSIGFKEMCC